MASSRIWSQNSSIRNQGGSDISDNGRFLWKFSQESIAEIPPPPVKPCHTTLPPSEYTRVYFDLETTGLGIKTLNIQIFVSRQNEPRQLYYALVMKWRSGHLVFVQLRGHMTRENSWLTRIVLSLYILHSYFIFSAGPF